MATVGTLFVNIAAKTSPFIQGVRGSMAQAKKMAEQSGKALTAYGQTGRNMFTGQNSYTAFSRLSAAVYGLSPAAGRSMFAVQKFGTSALNVGKSVHSSFMQLGSFMKFGWIGTILSVGAAVGAFMTRVTTLSIGRFKEIRGSLFAISRQWREITLNASRAFSPAVKAVTDLIGARLGEYFTGIEDAMVGIGGVGLVIVAIFSTLVEVIRMAWNIITAVGRTILGIVSYVASLVELVTDAVGLTDSSSNVSAQTGNELMGGAWEDVKDIGRAGYNIGDSWVRAGEGIGNLMAGPGASGLTEGGYGGSAALIDEARRQNTQLQRIENAILRTGGLN